MNFKRTTFYILFIFGLFLQLPLHATNYYIDAENGSDSNNGTTESTPWQSIEKLNQASFTSGDRILFKSGVEIKGQFKPKGNGTSSNPIFIGKYGGDALAMLNGDGNTAAIVLGSNQGYEIADVDIQNYGGEITGENSDRTRYGIQITNYTPGVKSYFYIHDIVIHNVYPVEATPDESNDPAYKGYGIQVTTGSNNDTYIKDVTIDNIEIYDIGYRGIISGRWGNVDEAYYYNQNFTITNSYIHHLGGSGIVPFQVKGLTVENNIIDHSGDTSDPRMIGRGSGIWMVRCVDTMIQYNKFMSARGKKDSCGAHIDIGNENTIIQYNYSYDNEGGFAELMGGNVNSIYRYNVSVNDGWRVKDSKTGYAEGIIFWLAGYMGKGLDPVGSVNSQVYNNTIYIGDGITSRYLLTHGTQNVFKNNILHIDGELIYDNRNDIVVDFDYNIYSGKNPTLAGFTPGSHSMVDVPSGIINPGGTEEEDYQIDETSPAIEAGYLFDIDLTEDYFNLPLGQETRNIGAHEFGASIEEPEEPEEPELPTSVEDFKNEVLVYPNPSNAIFNVKAINTTSYTLFNSLGQKIIEKDIKGNQFSIDLSSQNNGIYFMLVHTTTGVQKVKLVLNN